MSTKFDWNQAKIGDKLLVITRAFLGKNQDLIGFYCIEIINIKKRKITIKGERGEQIVDINNLSYELSKAELWSEEKVAELELELDFQKKHQIAQSLVYKLQGELNKRSISLEGLNSIINCLENIGKGESNEYWITIRLSGNRTNR